MKDWPPSPDNDELAWADSLLDQADALLRRHQSAAPASGAAPAAPSDSLFAGANDDDLPVLTEVVEDFALEQHWQEAAASPPPAAAPTVADHAPTAELAYRLAERLIEIDTEISRTIEEWMVKEFPQFLERELNEASERLQQRLHAHLRATLLPELSAHISRQIDAGLPPAEQSPQD